MGTEYYEFTDNGSNHLSCEFDNSSEKLTVEFDIMIRDMQTAGDVFGFVPYSDAKYGIGAGLRRNTDGTEWAPSETRFDVYLDVIDETYRKAETYRNKWIHVKMYCGGERLNITYTSDDGTVYVNNQPVPLRDGVGSADYPINKLVFGRVYSYDSDGRGTVRVRNLEIY